MNKELLYWCALQEKMQNRENQIAIKDYNFKMCTLFSGGSLIASILAFIVFWYIDFGFYLVCLVLSFYGAAKAYSLNKVSNQTLKEFEKLEQENIDTLKEIEKL